MEISDIDIVKKEQAVEVYTKILTSVMELIVSRYNSDTDYGWVDTKLSLITGLDYLSDDTFRGRNTIYGWIQGRALEALTYHARWFENNGENPELVDELKVVMRKLLVSLEHAREINGGHLLFFMDKDGRAFRTDVHLNIEYMVKGSITTYNLSDLFCSKGMYAAARYLGLSDAAGSAKKYCLDVIDAVWSGNFASDQFSFRGKITSSGCILNSIGPYMLLLDTVDMLLDDDANYAVKLGRKLIERIIGSHINLLQKWGFGQEYDCIENVDADGSPSVVDNTAESDPGHSIEFAGLAMKFICNARKQELSNECIRILDEYEDILINILKKNFANGYIKYIGGICKGFDLVTRAIIDGDMPWWSLPETMRASLYALSISHDYQMRDELWDIFYKCHNGFVNNYLRPELAYMSVQTLGTDGMVKDAIPATPDADPGYHTGICLIDCLRILEDLELEIEI